MTTDKSDLKIILASGEESRTSWIAPLASSLFSPATLDIKGPWHAWHCLEKSLGSGQK